MVLDKTCTRAHSRDGAARARATAHRKAMNLASNNSIRKQRRSVVVAVGVMVGSICGWLLLSPESSPPSHVYQWSIPSFTAPAGSFTIEEPPRIIGSDSLSFQSPGSALPRHTDALGMALLDLSYSPPPLDLREP